MMLSVLLSWSSGIILILLGLLHNLSGGPMMSRWLGRVSPPLAAQDALLGRVGWDFGGYLLMAVGISFLILGRSLPASYHLFWAIIVVVLGGILFYLFREPLFLLFLVAGLFMGAYYVYTAFYLGR